MLSLVFAFSFAGIAWGAATDIDLLNFQSGPTSGYKIIGPSANAYGGGFVNGAGDFNRDGLNDVLISAYQATISGRSSCGITYLIFGSRSFNTTALDLAGFKSGPAGLRIIGVNGASSGVYNSGGGDFNNDGYDDVLIGSQIADPDGVSDAGTVHVVFGFAGPFTDVDLASLPTSRGFRIRGAAATDWMYICAFIGDMNGDHFDDIVLAAQLADPVTNQEGIVYIIFGKSSVADINVGTYTFGTNLGFKLSGNGNNHQLGQFVGTAGDFNGDGYADAVVSSTRNQYSYVLFGHSNATSFPNILQASWATSSTVGFKVTSSASETLRAHGAAGDINSDGIDDLLLSGEGASPTYGVTYIIFGHRTGSFADITLPAYISASTGFSITGATSGDGTRGVYIGDINKDGRPDLGLSGSWADPLGRTDAGLGYIWYGGPTFSNVALSSFTTSESTGYKVIGAAAGDGVSQFPRFAKLGDVDGDGVDDVVYTSSSADALGRSECGIVYIMLSANRYPTSQPSSQPSRQPSRQPTSRPSVQPSSRPSAQPRGFPTSQPTRQPSTQPSSQPSVKPDVLQSILASPTYRVRNGFAFAVVAADGKGLSWGEAAYGGDSSAVQSTLESGVGTIIGSRFAFVAIKANGSLAAWGVNASVYGIERYGPLRYKLSTIVANEAAFAGVDRLTGRVIALGSKHHGGDVLDDAYCNGYSVQLSAGVRSITASSAAFTAIKSDGSLAAWGNKHAGADVTAGFLSTLAGAKMVVATTAAFAVLLVDNRVAAWGDPWVGGDTAPVADQLREVHHLVASRACFAAFKKDSSLVVWGFSDYGGDTSAVAAALSSHVVHVAHTFTAMAAIKADGTVVAWGAANAGGDATVVQASLQSVVRVYGNSKAFAALTATGGMVTWGAASHGGAIPVSKQAALASGVVALYHTDRAFAALKSTGQLVVWGHAGLGGEPSPAVEALLTSGVHTVCANDVAFSAIKTDGSVVVWGHSTSAAVQGVLFTSTSLTQPAICV